MGDAAVREEVLSSSGDIEIIVFHPPGWGDVESAIEPRGRMLRLDRARNREWQLEEEMARDPDLISLRRELGSELGQRGAWGRNPQKKRKHTRSILGRAA